MESLRFRIGEDIILASSAETTAAYRNRELPFVRVLDAVEQQSGETREFLGALLAYNQSIAEYAIAIVPPAIPEEKLVATLVLVR